MPSAAPSRSERSLPSPAGRVLRVSALAMAIGGLFVSGVPLCPVAFLTGYPCPGCGLTRAGLCLLQGDLGGAVALSPLSPIVIPFVAYVIGRAAWQYLRGHGDLPGRWITRGALGLWAALIVVWLLRFAGFFGGPVAVRSLW